MSCPTRVMFVVIIWSQSALCFRSVRTVFMRYKWCILRYRYVLLQNTLAATLCLCRESLQPSLRQRMAHVEHVLVIHSLHRVHTCVFVPAHSVYPVCCTGTCGRRTRLFSSTATSISYSSIDIPVMSLEGTKSEHLLCLPACHSSAVCGYSVAKTGMVVKTAPIVHSSGVVDSAHRSRTRRTHQLRETKRLI